MSRCMKQLCIPIREWRFGWSGLLWKDLGGCQVAFAVNYTDESLRIYHKDCGYETRSIPSATLLKTGAEIADQLIRQLELGDA